MLVIVRKGLLSLSLLLLVAGTSVAKLTLSKRFDDWGPVHSYIVNHAIYVSPGAEEKFYIEAHLGIETWELIGGSNLRQPMEGHGPGWPSTGEAILVATEEEAATLAALIRAATIGG